MSNGNNPISRRTHRWWGIAAGLIAGSLPLLTSLLSAATALARDDGGKTNGGFSQSTITQMEAIRQTTGTRQNSRLFFEFDHDDLQGYTIGRPTIPTLVPYVPTGKTTARSTSRRWAVATAGHGRQRGQRPAILNGPPSSTAMLGAGSRRRSPPSSMRS